MFTIYGVIKLSNSKSDLQGHSRAGTDELLIGGSRADAAESNILGVRMHGQEQGMVREGWSPPTAVFRDSIT